MRFKLFVHHKKLNLLPKQAMNILVTGADGLLGNNVVRELLQRQMQVTVLVQENKIYPTLAKLPITIVQGDLLHAESINKASLGIDVVIHCAANTSMFPARQELVNKVNIDGTQYIINACKSNNVKRLIYVGTANSFSSGTLAKPGNENNPYTAHTYGIDYMDSKYKAQELVLKAVNDNELDAVVVNPTFMIGPFDSRPSSGTMLIGIYNKKVPGYTLGGKNFVAVKDVAVAIANAITMGKKGECYLLGNANLTYKMAFEKIAAVAKVSAPRFKLSTPMVRLYGRFNSLIGHLFKFSPAVTHELAILASEEHYYTSAKAIKELQMPQTPIEDAINEALNWFIENNYIKINEYTPT